MILPEKKKLTILLLAVFLLTGCGAKANVTEVTEETVVQTTAPVQTTMAVETTAATEPTLPPIVYEMGEAHGTEVFFCNDTAFPVGLGYPKLSDGQIDALIEETDYAKIAETITTLPDAVNFCKRAGFTVGTTDIDPMISYGGLHHSKSAWKSLEEKICNERSFDSVFHYLLLGDYEEVGYVNARTSGDGHVMSYIRHEGIYYLINATDYVYMYNPDHTARIYDNSWIQDWPSEMICAAEDFQTIADSLMKYMKLGNGQLPNLVHLVQSPGDYVVGSRGGMRLYPEECTVTEYYGYGVAYGQATALDWKSQTRLDS